MARHRFQDEQGKEKTPHQIAEEKRHLPRPKQRPCLRCRKPYLTYKKKGDYCDKCEHDLMVRCVPQRPAMTGAYRGLLNFTNLKLSNDLNPDLQSQAHW